MANLDLSIFKFNPGEAIWIAKIADIEFAIAGGSDGPNPLRIEFAAKVLSRIDEFTSPQVLRFFPGNWADITLNQTEATIEGISFGRNSEPASEFTVDYCFESDVYGRWSLSFRDGQWPETPFRFSRESI